MKISARNPFEGTANKVVPGPVGAEISIDVAPGVEVVPVITDASKRELGLKEGMTFHAIIKASNVMIAVD